ncbi:hypothetical protein ACFVJ5_08430 [Nocardia sp. NPDC127606]|uniref:hypothetical protein n=1 Tax=Nocardia sp. NPDC127606 TaxID=3345406 RepID=UPI0036356DAB
MTLVEAMNAAQAEKATAATELERKPQVPKSTAVQIEKLIDGLGDVWAVFDSGSASDQIAPYAAIELADGLIGCRRVLIPGSRPGFPCSVFPWSSYQG